MIKITAPYTYIAVFGLGITGVEAVRALRAGGVKVTAWDDDEKKCKVAADLGAVIQELIPMPEGVEALVLSPGVPLTHPAPHKVVTVAEEASIPIIGDMELFQKARTTFPAPSQVIAITGTNGKSTTAALTAHLLAESGMNVELGGNIGQSVLALSPAEENTIYVLELSSYQIDLSPRFSPDIAVLLNLSPDHLDRHGSMQGYIQAKWQMFENLLPGSTAIIGIDGSDEINLAEIAETNDAIDSVRISGQAEKSAKVFCQDGWLCDQEGPIVDLSCIATLQGAHNGQNAAAAYVAALSAGAARDDVIRAFASFQGLAHRMQPVGEIISEDCEVLFVNDSKATNAEASAHALATYEKIYWIAGGISKEGGIDRLSPYFDRIACAYLIGTASEVFSHTLSDTPHVVSETLDKAVPQAVKDALAAGGGVVLFSPACASFDQFENFGKRGAAFCELVNEQISRLGAVA
jgi:UDP-N-acetylmuramoylalanine--D-glutamate ligase